MNSEDRLKKRLGKITDGSVHIAPVGFEEDRVTHGLIKLGARKVYLLVDEKDNKGGKKSRSHADNIKKKLRG